MSRELINLNPDLKRLADEGYALEVRDGFALVSHVPYLNASGDIKYGTLVSTLNMAGDRTQTPDTHVIYFSGQHPCNKDGSEIRPIKHGSQRTELQSDVVVDHSFSNRPKAGYVDYYEKFTTYINVIMAPAYSKDNSVTAQPYQVIETAEDESVFMYMDTNASRAKIGAVNEKLKGLKIAIIGVGGTGSYVLDFVAKTPVSEIHLFDKDMFLQHNAFRAPGAPSVQELRALSKKIERFNQIYSNMHRHITLHDDIVNSANVQALLSLDFVFLCIDDGPTKKTIIEALIKAKVPFIDCGISVQVIDGAIFGALRVTAGTPTKNDHIRQRITFSPGDRDEYSTNIQIAELNALAAVMAVIRWKKFLGFYQDFVQEHHSTYDINTGEFTNAEGVF